MDKKIKETYSYKICPDCSYFCSYFEEDLYCSLCGAKLIDTCPSCGERILNPYAACCKSCGKFYPGRKSKKNNKHSF